MQEMLGHQEQNKADLIGEQQTHFSGKKYSQPGLYTKQQTMLTGLVLHPEQTALHEEDSEDNSLRNNQTKALSLAEKKKSALKQAAEEDAIVMKARPFNDVDGPTLR